MAAGEFQAFLSAGRAPFVETRQICVLFFKYMCLNHFAINIIYCTVMQIHLNFEYKMKMISVQKLSFGLLQEDGYKYNISALLQDVM